MSVIVKGMEMPKKCGQCKLYHIEYPMYCLAVEGHRTVGAPYGMPRPDWCPLTELPPHGRLIDADKFAETVIGKLPSIQPKRGKWNRPDMDTFNCNQCGATFVLNQGSEKMHFCPNCGADMRGDNNG